MRFLGLAATVMLGLTGPALAQAPPQLLTFTAFEGDIAFQYPETYAVEEATEDFGGDPVRLIILSDVSAEVPEFGEGPPTITIQIVRLPPNVQLDSWVRTNDISNFVFSLDGRITRTIVGGADAMAYRYSGLYENDAVAVAGNGVVYLFSAGWIAEDDRIREDFRTVLESVRFNSP